MRYYEILNEKIVNRPRNLPYYLQKKIAIFNKLVADYNEASRLIKENEYDGGKLAETFLRYGSDFSDAATDISALDWWASSSDSSFKRFEIENFRDNLESFRKFGSNFLGYILNAFQENDYNPWTQRVKDVIDILPTAEKGAQDYGYEPGQDHSDDPEYQAAQQYLKGLRLMADVIIESGLQVKEIKEKLGIIYKMAHDYNGKYRPEHEPVEILYHASAYATEIMQSGFQAEKPSFRIGVGNFGTQDTISFTHDLKIAQDIMRALKDIWMIAHGQLTARQIMGWLQAEGIDYKDQKFVNNVGVGEEIPNEKGFELSLPRYRVKQVHELKTPEEALKLYNVYLWHSKIRTNPVFAGLDGLLQNMKSRSIKDIGIVACEVELSDEHEYLQGEAEFRVPASAVKSVKRIM